MILHVDFPADLRSIARIVYNVFGIINGVIMPYFLNPTALNWGAKTGLFWAGMCSLCILWTYFRVPEPKGRTYGELDVLFETHVPARRFRKTVVDQFEGDANHGQYRSHQVEDVDSKEKEAFDHIEA